MASPRRTLEGVVVPDAYPEVPQSVDVRRVAPEVARPFAFEARRWALAVVAGLFLILGAVVWAALESRWTREAQDRALREQQMKEALHAQQRR